MEEHLRKHTRTRQTPTDPHQPRPPKSGRLHMDELSRIRGQHTAGKWGRAIGIDEEQTAPKPHIEEMDSTNPAANDSTVPSTHDNNTDLIDLYSVGHVSVHEQWKKGKDEVPFKQTLQLKGPQGETVRVSALFDGGAMVGAMCSTIFRMVKHRLSGWGPSRRQLQMANGTIIPSEAV